MRRHIWAISHLLVALHAPGNSQPQAEGNRIIRVSPTGDDAWSGRLAAPNAQRTDGPVRTLPRAQVIVRDALRQMAESGRRTTIAVSIAPGNYRLFEPLVFTPADSGEAGFPVVYTAERSGTAVITGGVELDLMQAAGKSGPAVFKSPADDRLAIAGGTQLFVNGDRATLTRFPNAGSYWFVQQAASLVGEPASERGRAAFVPSKEAKIWIDSLSEIDRKRAIVQVMQSWSSGRHRFSEFAAPTNAVSLTPRARWSFLEFGLNQRYFIENTERSFDKPGEWLWDSKSVRYIPLASQRHGPITAVMPMIETLMVIKGEVANKRLVHDLEFRGLAFKHTRLLTPKDGDFDNQAGIAIDAAVMVDGAHRIAFDRCDIAQVGGYGIWLRESVRDSSITRTNMRDLGGGGIKIGLPMQPLTDTAATGRNLISANIVRDTGKVIPGSVGIWLGQTFDNQVIGNLVANTTYTGISIGWKWGQGPATSGRNQISKNLLLNIGMGQLGDLGAIYTLGESPGTTITENVVQEVRAYPGYGAGAWGIYNDEGSSGLLIKNNIVMGTSSGGYHLHYGRDNKVDSNVFAWGDETEVRLPSSGIGEMRLQFNDNLLLASAASAITAPVTALAANVTFEGNIFGSVAVDAGESRALNAVKPDICGPGCRPGKADIRLAADVRKSSLTSTEPQKTQWFASVIANAGPVDLPAAQLPLIAKPEQAQFSPPLALNIDIANTAIGSQPLGLSMTGGIAGGKISVEAVQTSPTGRCLRFNDTPNPIRPWEPFASARLNHTSGKTRVHFTLLIDQRSDFVHEWRDDAKPYQSGPLLRVSIKGVEAGGKIIAKVTPGQWVDIVVEANLDDATRRWQVDVSGAAGNGRSEGLLPVTAGWSSLKWLGFISAADVETSACIGLIEVTHQAKQ